MREASMKCRTHPSVPGDAVCALCLRKRLSALVSAAGEDGDPPTTTKRQNPEKLSFTPTADNDFSAAGCATCKFSLVSSIWGNPIPKKGESNSWQLLALILRRRERNQKKSPAAEIDRGRSRKPHVPPVNGRGMSPAVKEEAEEGSYVTEPLPPGRFLSTLSPLWRAQTGNPQQHSASGFSSFVLCLSLLARPSPGSRRSMAPAEKAFAGELHRNFNRRCAGGRRAAVADAIAALAPNRSR